MNRTLTATLFAALAATAPATASDYFQPLTSQDTVYNWNGVWLGIGGGSGMIIEEINAPVFGTTISGVGGRGYFGKLTVGYDHMFSNGAVLGASVSGRYGDVEMSWSVPGSPFNGSVSADYGIDVIGRLGYSITPRTLFYVLGGYSWQHFELSSTSHVVQDGWDDNGYVVGFGTETAFRNNWTWASEYRYSSYTGANIGGFGGLGIDPVTHTFHSSLNYRFGGGPTAETRAPIPYAWSGLKIGAAVSLGVAISKFSTAGGSTYDGLATEGFLGEVNVGYDREFGERWLAGVVLAAEYIDASTSATGAGVTATAEADDFGFDALLRVGRKFNDRSLGYLIGGYSWQRVAASLSFPAISDSISVNGFSFGSGLEHVLSERVTGYIEYRYTMYEDISLGAATTIEPASHTVRAGAKLKLY